MIIVLGNLKYMVRPLTNKNLSMIGNWDHDFHAHRYTSQFHTEYTQFTVRCTVFGENGTDAFAKKDESIDFTYA